MHPFNLTLRDVVVIDGLRWLPATLMEDGIALVPESGGVARNHRWSDLGMMWVDQRMRIEPEPCKGLPRTLVEDMRRDLTSFTEAEQKEAHRRRRYIRGLELGLYLRDLRRTSLFRPVRKTKPSRIVLQAKPLDLLCERIAKVVEPNGVAGAPCGASLLEWYKRFRLSGRCLSALVPQSHRQGNRVPRLSPIAVEIMNKYARDQFLQLERFRPVDIFASVRDEIRTAARKAGKRGDEIEAVIPNIRSFYRIIESIGAREKTRYREGAKKADRYRLRGQGPRYQYIGQAIQIDSTLLPIVLRDVKTGLTFKQVTLTVAIDLATRAIVGFYVGLEKGFATIQEALRMAMLPKNWVADLEGIKNRWIATVKPEIAFTDHGKDYRSTSLLMSGARLNIRLLRTPAGAPDLKGIVERQFRESKEGMFSGMPGSLFKHEEPNIDYDAAGNAMFDMNQINWIICKFIADIYMVGWHEGIEDSPAEAWRKLSAVRRPEMAPSIDQLIPLLSTTTTVTIQHTGCEWNSLFYGTDSLDLQALMDREGPGRRQFTMNIDTMDVGRAYLLVDGRWIVLKASDPDARGRKLHDHLVIRAEARSRKKTIERLNQADMDSAKHALRAEAERRNEQKAAKRDNLGTRSRMARFLVEGPDNLKGMKSAFIESVDPTPSKHDQGLEDVDFLAVVEEPDVEEAMLPRARPQRPSRPKAASVRPEPRSAKSAAPRPAGGEKNSTAAAVAAPVQGAPKAAVPKMPSAVAASAAAVMPRRRRFSIVDFH